MTTQPPTQGDRPRGGSVRVDPDDPTVLHLEGEVDIAVVHAYAGTLGLDEIRVGRALAAAGIEEVDLSRATFLDSAAIALLVSIAPHRRPARLRVRGAHGAPLLTLRLTGLDTILDLGQPQT